MYQSHQQQRLLRRYGQQVILTEMSRMTHNLPFPFFGIFVQTNVDYQLVYLFILQSRTKEALVTGLESIVHWNPSWSPKYVMVDFSAEQTAAVEAAFPGSIFSFEHVIELFCK